MALLHLTDTYPTHILIKTYVAPEFISMFTLIDWTYFSNILHVLCNKLFWFFLLTMEKFVIVRDTSKTIRWFIVSGRSFEFNLRPIAAGIQPIGWVWKRIDSIMKRGIKGLQPSDDMGLICPPKDINRCQKWYRFTRAMEVTFSDIWNSISSTELNTKSFCLGLTTIRMPVCRRKSGNYNNFDEVLVSNCDNLCLPRPLVVAIAYIEKNTVRQE